MNTHFRATSLETLRSMVAAGEWYYTTSALAVPQERKRDGVDLHLPCSKPEPRVVPWGWFIAQDRRCVAVMSNW